MASGVFPILSAHLLSFANRRYAGSLARLRGEAAAVGRFAGVRTLDERALSASYWLEHADTVRRHPRGYGLWTWKPHVIAEVLAELQPGELLVYCDAGCSLNAEGAPRLEEYLNLAADHPAGLLAFSLDGQAREWIKRQTLSAFGCDTAEFCSRPMIMAGVLVLRSGPVVRDFVTEWAARMADLSLVDDSPSPGGEHQEFRAHRHDQSIFTILAHQRGVATIRDETWWPGEWDSKRAFPIHARRWRQRLPWPQWWMRHAPWPRW